MFPFAYCLLLFIVFYCMSEYLSGGSSLAQLWKKRSIACQVSACWNALGSKVLDGVHSVAPDATRLGKPAKDLLSSPYWNSQQNTATWMLPQER